MKPKSVRADKGRPVGSGLVHRLPQRLQVCVSENGWKWAEMPAVCWIITIHEYNPLVNDVLMLR